MLTQNNASHFDTDTRGQLMLMGAIVVVISLVVLVVALNTVLYSANLESREATPEIDLAEDYVKTLESEYESVIQAQNQKDYATASTASEQATTALIETNQIVAAQYAESHGVYATIDPVRTTNATVIKHTNPACSFESADADCGNNDDPIASFSMSPNPQETSEQVDFDGTVSSDDGSINSYEWDLDGDGTTDATGSTVSATYGDSGTYTVTLTVTDNDGNTASEEKQLTIENTGGNTNPSASFSYSPSNPNKKETVTFDASTSDDPDGTITQYEWDFDNDGTTDATGETATNSFNPQGDYPVTLTVTDDDGATTTTQKTITVTKGGGGKGNPFSIAQPPVGESAGAGSTTDWTLVEQTSQVRNFQFTVDKDSLGIAINQSAIQQSFLRDDAFYVRVEGESNVQRIYIFRSEADDIVVASQLNDGTINTHYSENIESASIDLTTGRINGEQTSFVLANSMNGPYEIAFRNGEVASGTYKLVVPNSPASTTDIERGNFNDAPDTTSPYLSHGVYSVRVRITFDMAGISYQTTKFIAPDQPTRFDP